MNFKRAFVILTGWWISALITFSAYEVGDIVADFSLFNSEGDEISLYDFTGLPVIVEIWTDT